MNKILTVSLCLVSVLVANPVAHAQDIQVDGRLQGLLTTSMKKLSNVDWRKMDSAQQADFSRAYYALSEALSLVRKDSKQVFEKVAEITYTNAPGELSCEHARMQAEHQVTEMCQVVEKTECKIINTVRVSSETTIDGRGYHIETCAFLARASRH